MTPVGRGRRELLEPSLRRLRRRHHHVAAPISSPKATTTPTPMPALAPVLSPPVLPGSTSVMPLPVGVVVTSAQWAEELKRVHDWVAAQQPPPRLEAHEIWLVVQPAGITGTRGLDDDVGMTVDTHWRLERHTES